MLAITNQRDWDSTTRSLPAIAKMLAAKGGFTVHFDAGRVPYATKNSIHLPQKMKAVGTTQDAILLNGFLDHEAAHIRYTNFEVLKQVRSMFEKTFLNVLEDVRIEYLQGKVYPGCKHNLAAVSLILDSQVMPTGMTGGALITNFCGLTMRKRVIGQQIDGADAFHAAVLPILGEKLRDEISELAYLASLAKDTQECYDYVRKIVDLLQDKSQDQPKPPPQKQKPDDSKSDESDKSGEAEDDATPDDKSGEAEDDATPDDKSGEAEDDATPDDKSGEAEDDATPDDKSGEAEDADDHDADAIKQALKSAGSNGFADAMSELLEGLDTLDEQKQVEAEEIDVCAKSQLNPGRFSTAEADSGARKVSSRFDALLWARSNTQPYPASSGKLKPNRLTSVVTQRNTKIFDKVDEEDGLNTAIQVLFDTSYSMNPYMPGSNRYAATQIAAIIASVCERHDGIVCGVAGFDDVITPVKSFDEKWPRVGRRLDFVTRSGGTAMGAAHSWSLGEIYKRRENRRIILIATDGAPNSYPALQASVAEALNAGIETRFVLIGDDVSLEDFQKEITSATCVSQALTPDLIPDAILTALKGGLGIN